MAQLPHRISNHEIDAEACKIVTMKFNRNWEIRDITGRDFGIDKIVERFQDGYATSEMMMLQIKGTEKEIDYNNPKFSLDTKTLLYAEMFAYPFLLIFCSIDNPNQCYYVWLQEYIRVCLNYDNKDWRKQDSNTIYFPPNNILGTEESEEHLLYISQFPKYKDAWIQYCMCLMNLGERMPRNYCYEEMSLNDIKDSIEGIANKLEKAIIYLEHIPTNVITQKIIDTIVLAKEFEQAKEILPAKKYWQLGCNCELIRSTISVMGWRFAVETARILYETEGVADF